ncbi:hypothetical protein HGM15179_020964 [Zosterops borbonicus]|uniref:Retroviral nucleocapsid Gag protein p24 C-terminal domain-containing protein n=1 Tax=Zosterops borbonicus TaxID=364589 RepID=A0A8K1FTP4_9PASS|nr:hypothetical protein HGM15179_020964 [Zosterops borbonicus]
MTWEPRKAAADYFEAEKRPINEDNPEGKHFSEDLMSRQSTDPDLRILSISKLTGDSPDDKNEDQVNLPRTVLDDIKKTARKAFLQIQPAGTFEKAYNLICQDSSEPFTTFVDRVIQAAERQCSDDIAHPIMIRDIIENNANVECKRAIKALGKE